MPMILHEIVSVLDELTFLSRSKNSTVVKLSRLICSLSLNLIVTAPPNTGLIECSSLGLKPKISLKTTSRASLMVIEPLKGLPFNCWNSTAKSSLKAPSGFGVTNLDSGPRLDCEYSSSGFGLPSSCSTWLLSSLAFSLLWITVEFLLEPLEPLDETEALLIERSG